MHCYKMAFTEPVQNARITGNYGGRWTGNSQTETLYLEWPDICRLHGL